jgi:hypothetical protein
MEIGGFGFLPKTATLHALKRIIPSPRPSGERERERGFESRYLSPNSVGREGEIPLSALDFSPQLKHLGCAFNATRERN